MRTIEECWKGFHAILPKDAPAIQVQETRRAFYAGFAACLGLFQKMGNDDLSDDAGAAILEGLHEEVMLFASRLGVST